MNFLKHFLQGKASIINEEKSNPIQNGINLEDKHYPLSRSATYPSYTVSLTRIKSGSLPTNLSEESFIVSETGIKPFSSDSSLNLLEKGISVSCSEASVTSNPETRNECLDTLNNFTNPNESYLQIEISGSELLHQPNALERCENTYEIEKGFNNFASRIAKDLIYSVIHSETALNNKFSQVDSHTEYFNNLESELLCSNSKTEESEKTQTSITVTPPVSKNLTNECLNKEQREVSDLHLFEIQTIIKPEEGFSAPEENLSLCAKVPSEELEQSAENEPSGDNNNFFELVFDEPKKTGKPPQKFLNRRKLNLAKKSAAKKAKLQKCNKTPSDRSEEKATVPVEPSQIKCSEESTTEKQSSSCVENEPVLYLTNDPYVKEIVTPNLPLELITDTSEIERQIEQDLLNLISNENTSNTGSDLEGVNDINPNRTGGDFGSENNCSSLTAVETNSSDLENKSESECVPITNLRSNSIVSSEPEFEVVGSEANRLAEELSINESTLTINVLSMEENTQAQESPNATSLEPSTPTEECKTYEKRSNMKDTEKFSQKDTQTLQVGDSEAGPDIAPGLTSSDLKCASQFFKEAAELESQIRRNITSSIGSLNDFAAEACSFSETDMFSNSNAKAMPTPSSPPHEERSAPEGTSSPDPRSLEDSEVRSHLQKSSEYSSSQEVNELLKKQALEFEEKLLRQGIVAAEKEKELHEILREEQKEMQKVTASRDALLKLVEQYKGMLGTLLADKEKVNVNNDEKIKTLETEKQQAIEDLGNVEAAFSDVHRKYERTKQIVDSLRRNEETLRGAVADYEEKLLKQECKFAEFQKHAEEKVQLANEEFEALRRSNDQEMTKMGALLKKAEMKIISLQESLERKTTENQELTQLCDDLISKVGS